MSFVLSGNQISELRRDDLRSLAVSLKTLDLSGNSLASVPEGIFWDLQVEQSSPSSFIKLEIRFSSKGPYIKDVRKIFGIFDPLPPLVHIFLLFL